MFRRPLLSYNPYKQKHFEPNTMSTTFAITPEPELKDLGHRHYNGKGIIHSIESCGAVDGPGVCATCSFCKAA